MGIDTEAARFLLIGQREGASFKRCATLGRQNLFLGNRETAALLREYGLDPAKHPDFFATPYTRFRYAEPFWEMLGAIDLLVLDASDFEGAKQMCVHDLNQPIPDDLKGRFDAVCDFGTLEHVFNFPVALRSCLEMVKVGGHLFIQTPANNYFGHGFYQFSPELFFRVLSKTNGFELERMVVMEYGPLKRWFAVKDPEAVRDRANLINGWPVMLAIRARKTAEVPVLREPVQQSDYAAAWSQQASPEQAGAIDSLASPKLLGLKQAILERAPQLARLLETFRISVFSPKFSFRNRDVYLRLDKHKLGKPG
jgi:SAM-dependent methyltransferase